MESDSLPHYMSTSNQGEHKSYYWHLSQNGLIEKGGGESSLFLIPISLHLFPRSPDDVILLRMVLKGKRNEESNNIS